MNPYSNTFARTAFFTAFAVLVGICLYLLFVQRSALSQLDRSVKTAEAASSRLIYGIVTSVDEPGRNITIRFINSFSGDTVNAQVEVGDGAYIARQELEPAGAAVFTSLSSPSGGSLADIKPGMRVAADIHTSTPGGIRSMLILYGNPL